MVTAPEDDIVAEGDERLDDIVLEDEAMLAQADITPNKSVRTDVRCRLIAPGFCRLVKAGS